VVRIFLYGPHLLSTVRILKTISLWSHYPESIFWKCTPFALVLCGSCIAIALYERR
jgi:hypothetical protein